MVQLSDVIIGIIGKLMLYANVSTLAESKRNGIIISTARKEYLSAEQSD